MLSAFGGNHNETLPTRASRGQSGNGRVYVFPIFRINVRRKGFIPLLATEATVTGIHSL